MVKRGIQAPSTSTSATAKKSRAQAEWVDVHVGQRVRDKRNERGVSQTEMANALRVAFQQVQKFKSGTNRVGASRLYDLAQVLGAQVQCYFEGLKNQPSAPGDDAENIVHAVEPDTT